MELEIQEESEMKTKSIVGETEEIDFDLGESINEAEYLEEEENAQEESQMLTDYQKEIIFDEMGEEEESKINYIDIQVENILSDYERKLLWDEYKKYVDNAVFAIIKNTILCR